MNPKYTSVNVLPEGAADLRLFAAQVGGHLGRRVTMTEALRIAVRMATARPTEDVWAAAVALDIINPPPPAEPAPAPRKRAPRKRTP